MCKRLVEAKMVQFIRQSLIRARRPSAVMLHKGWQTSAMVWLEQLPDHRQEMVVAAPLWDEMLRGWLLLTVGGLVLEVLRHQVREGLPAVPVQEGLLPDRKQELWLQGLEGLPPLARYPWKMLPRIIVELPYLQIQGQGMKGTSVLRVHVQH